MIVKKIYIFRVLNVLIIVFKKNQCWRAEAVIQAFFEGAKASKRNL